jgi:hypothetical protein
LFNRRDNYMKKKARLLIWSIMIFFVIGISSAVFASNDAGQDQNKSVAEQGKEEDAENKEKTIKKTSSGILLSYKPPLRGKPGKRVGGASRGMDDGALHLLALSPDHTGLTVEKQPALYWYISKPTATRIEITLNDERSVNPLLEIEIGTPDRGGIHGIRLSDYNISLLPGKEYQWFIAVVTDPEQRARDIVDTGMIERVRLPEKLSEALSRSKGIEVAVLYAGEGLWYDALSSISDLIEANPDDVYLRQQRATLLEQAGLDEAAEQERTLR